jgi:Ca2+-binding EF-hand superfamily protein
MLRKFYKLIFCGRMQVNEKERKELQEIFDLVDRDKGGTISPDELYQLMKTIGVPATKESVMQVLPHFIPPFAGLKLFETLFSHFWH